MIRARYRDRMRLDPVRRMAMEQRVALRRARVAMRAARASGDWLKSDAAFYQYIDATSRPWDFRLVPSGDPHEPALSDEMIAAVSEWVRDHSVDLNRAWTEALAYGRSYSYLSPSITLREPLDQVQGSVRLV